MMLQLLVQVFNSSLLLLLHVVTFLQLCVINFSLIFDPSLPWKWWRHMWMTLILLNLKFVNWMAFHFLLENMLETLKFGSWPNFSRLSYMIGAFMICIYDLSMCEFGAFIILYLQHKNIFWHFSTAQQYMMLVPSQKTNLIKCRPRKKNNLHNETMNPSFQKERKKLL